MTSNKLYESDCLYGLNDMVRADCGDCQGCCSCCVGMGESIRLDPYDVYLLTGHLKKTMDELLQKEIELHVEDGLILPNLAMQGKEECCAFLDADKRCSIHAFRPGICRLFPLGRQYEEGTLKYFLVPGECSKENRSKVKVKKWLDVPNVKRYQKFLIEWHSLKKQVIGILEKETSDQVKKDLNLFILNLFYRKPYQTEDFYEEFDRRMKQARKVCGGQNEIR